MFFSYNEDNDDPKAPARGIVISTLFMCAVYSIIAGVVFFFFLNGWSFR